MWLIKVETWGINRVSLITERSFFQKAPWWRTTFIVNYLLASQLFHGNSCAAHLTDSLEPGCLLSCAVCAASNSLAKLLFQGNVYNKAVLLVSSSMTCDCTIRMRATLIDTHQPTQRHASWARGPFCSHKMLRWVWLLGEIQHKASISW